MNLIERLKRLLLPFEYPDHPLYYDKDAEQEVYEEDPELADLIDEVL